MADRYSRGVRSPEFEPVPGEDNVSEQMATEWRAWQCVCSQLTKHGIYINNEDMLWASLIAWAEELATLRREQDDSTVETILASARRSFDEAAEQQEAGE